MRSLYASTAEVADKATNPTQSAQVKAPIGVKSTSGAILLKFVTAIPLKFVKTGAQATAFVKTGAQATTANTKRTNSGFCVRQQG